MKSLKVLVLSLAIISGVAYGQQFKMPQSCKEENMEYCFDDTDYPTGIVDELLKDITNLEVSNEVQTWNIAQRSSVDEDDCSASSTDAPIYYIVDDRGVDRVVVQREGKFQQRYGVVRCMNEGKLPKRTHHFSKSVIDDYMISCQNKYLQNDFLVLSEKPDANGVWKMERARTKTGIPVCCVCRYEQF